MQRKILLFLSFILCFANNAQSLNSRKSGTFVSKTESRFNSNVANIDDSIEEGPNEAFLFPDSEVVSYVSVDNDFVLVQSQPEDIQKEISEIKVSNISKNQSSVKKQLSEIKKQNVKRSPVDYINVGEGEEVLVSVSDSALVPVIEKLVGSVTEVAKLDTVSPLKSIDIIDVKNDESPFGVEVSNIVSSKSLVGERVKNDIQVSNNVSGRKDISFGVQDNPFVRAFSSLKPESVDVQKVAMRPRRQEKVVAMVSPRDLKRDMYHTYIRENKYLAPVEYYDEEMMEDAVDDEFENEVNQTNEQYVDDANFSSQKNVGQAMEGVGGASVSSVKEKIQKVKALSAAPTGPLKMGGREVLQMKLDFDEKSSAISSESVNILRSFAQVATDMPTNSIEISISQSVMQNSTKKKLAAKRLAIVSNVLRNSGISDKQIYPVLTDRDEESFSFRVINNDKFNKLRVAKSVDMFGDEDNIKEYDLMKW